MLDNQKPLFSVQEVSKSYGGVRAVQNCSFSVYPGSIVGLIGPNGSGKTTLFNLMTGLDSVDSGTIYFKDEDITRLKTYQIAQKGLSRTFQDMRLFWKLSILDNMIAAGLQHANQDVEAKALDLLTYVGLRPFTHKPASNLSFGQQRLLQFGIALMNGADLILLDEPTAGVNPKMIDNLLSLVNDLRRNQNKTFLVVEHNMFVVMSLCDQVIVLDEGKKIAEGEPHEIKQNKSVIEAYFGKMN